MENTDNVKRFKWSKAYLLQLKNKGTWFFYPVWRNESCITFEYRKKDGGELEELHAIVFVPTGHDYEVAGPIEWQGKKVFLEANRCIQRGYQTRKNENEGRDVLVGDKWVKYEEFFAAIKEKDKEFMTF